MIQSSTIVEALLLQSILRPDHVAFSIDTGESIRYGPLAREVWQWAGALRRLGLSEGGRCAIILPTGLDSLRVLFGTQVAGGAPAGIAPSLPTQTILKRLDRIDCDLAVCQPSLARVLNEIPRRARIVTPDQLRREVTLGSEDTPFRLPPPDSAAFLQFTSGTTGESRAAVLRHDQLVSNLVHSATGLREDEVMVSWLPLYHDLGLVRFVFTPVMHGFSCHLLQPSLGNLGAWLETLHRVRGTVTGSPDFGYRLAARAVPPDGLDLSALRFATNGGESVRTSTIDRFESRFGAPGTIMPGYGLAEATLTVASMIPGMPRRVDAAGHISCGPIDDSLTVRIVDRKGEPLPPGEAGEIVVRGDRVFSGYLGEPAETRLTLADGWLHTGDTGYLDPDGFLFVLGRKRTMIKRGGVTFAPREIEEAVDQLSFVRMAGAIGVPHAVGSERMVVVVEIEPSGPEPLSVLLRRISDVTRSVIGSAPDEILPVRPGSIPVTLNGKLRYDRLREHYLEGRLSLLRDMLSASCP